MSSNSRIIQVSEVHFFGEDDTGTPGSDFLLDLASGSNSFTYVGDFNFTPGMGTNIASGAILTHWLDDWAYFNAAQNQFGNSVLFSASVTEGTATWSHGAGAPGGSCAKGSLYSNTSGAVGSTLYTCVNSAWVDIK